MHQFGTLFREANVLPAIASGQKTASGIVYTGRALLTGVKLVTDGTNDGSIIVYDSLSASGKIVDKFSVNGDENFGGCMYGKAPVIVDTGIYIALSGTAVEAYLFYAIPSSVE